MEMAETRLIFSILAAFVITSCSAPRMTWNKVEMDGSRVGASALTGDNVVAAFGTVQENGVYSAPNGKEYTDGCIPEVALEIISRQPGLAYLKRVIGYAPETMDRVGIEPVLGDWTVDALMLGVKEKTGKDVDFGIVNRGGIRIDMPKGPIMLEDIVSMFPFKNYLVYIELKGSDLRKKVEDIVEHGGLQVFGGCRIVVENRKLKSFEIAGSPVDDNRIYGVATIDFLMNGGDGVSMAEGAVSVEKTDCRVSDWMIEYISSLDAEGRKVEAEKDGRIIVIQ